MLFCLITPHSGLVVIRNKADRLCGYMDDDKKKRSEADHFDTCHRDDKKKKETYRFDTYMDDVKKRRNKADCSELTWEVIMRSGARWAASIFTWAILS